MISSLVNRGEAIELAGGEAEEAARELVQKGAGAVVLTLGADGAAFVSADRHVSRSGASGHRHRHGRRRRCVLRGAWSPRKALGRGWRDALARRSRSRFDFGHAKGRPCFLSVPGGDGGYLGRATVGRLEENQQ